MSDQHQAPDPIELLRRSDPVDPHQLPPGMAARLAARVREDRMTDNGRTERTADRNGGFWPALAGIAATVAVVAVVAATGVIGRVGPVAAPSAEPTPAVATPGAPTPAPTAAPTGGPVQGGGTAMCAFLYDLQTLKDREWAFDGTVMAIGGETGNQFTFAVNRWFRGGSATEITVTADGMSSESGLLGGPGLVIGGRYLVTGEDEFAWSCGFTQYWNEAVAADWARVLGG